MPSELTQPGNLIKGLLDFAFPPLCVGCGDFCERPIPLCSACLRRLQTYDFPFCLTCGQMISDVPECSNCRERSFVLFAFGNYVDPLKEAIAHFKFKGITSPAGLIAERIVEKFHEGILMLEPHALVPIPLHPSREHARGYNQAELLSEELSKRLDIPTDCGILIRTKKRKEQARLSDRDRERNIAGVFEAVADAEPGETVILVDDVVTGGYTVTEAKRELERAGFRVPAAIAMAHGL
jgi:ComF family protein